MTDLAERFASLDPARPGWVVVHDGHMLCESDLTVEQAIAVSRLAGGGWETVNPLHSPAACAAVVVTLLVTKAGRDEKETAREVDAMKASDLLGCVIQAG